MNTIIKKILPVFLVVCIVALSAFELREVSKPMKTVNAQSMIRDQPFGFSGSINSTAATVITATTTASRIGGPAQIVGVNARFHVKAILVTSATSGVVSYFEHPTSGSDIFICNAPVLANVGTTVKAGNNEPLGLDGWITAPGSSIKATFNNTTAALVTHTVSASLE